MKGNKSQNMKGIDNMSVKFNWNEMKNSHPAFADIREDEYFLFNNDLFIKINPIYAADELESEIDDHDLSESDDIESTKYNAYCVNDPSYFYLSDANPVERVDVEISIIPKGEKHNESNGNYSQN